jgi:histidinol-phosphate/aromatic aminotransferase/cobyric acid decarboxylase-like protein
MSGAGYVGVDDAAVRTWAMATDTWHVNGTVVRKLAQALLDARAENAKLLAVLREARTHCHHAAHCAMTQASVHNRLFDAACTCGFSEWWTEYRAALSTGKPEE